MQIKHQMLAHQLGKKIAPLYLLAGQDHYLLNDSLATIKSAIKKAHEYDERIIHIHTPEDWHLVHEEANSYSLFSETVLLTLFFDKKSIDAIGKKTLDTYLNSMHSHCFIVINAPNVPVKQVQWLCSHEQAVVLVAYPLNEAAMKNWITTQLKSHSLTCDPPSANIIYQYTQGNMLACAQVIEKIALSCLPNSKINVLQVQEHLYNQCEHNLFELVDACLQGAGDKAIQILRHAANNKTETTLVLWMLTQEVRTLLQFTNLVQLNIDIKSAASQLKVWPQRINLYQASCKRLNKNTLRQLHHYCCCIDEHIKSNVNIPIWNSLENLALSLCSGRLMGDACTV